MNGNLLYYTLTLNSYPILADKVTLGVLRVFSYVILYVSEAVNDLVAGKSRLEACTTIQPCKNDNEY